MSEKTITITNQLNISKEAIIAETPSMGQKRIVWDATHPPVPITFPVEETLNLTIENGADMMFGREPFGNIEFPAWAEYDFKPDPTCPGEISITRSESVTKITIKEGEAGFSLDLKFPEGAAPRPVEENVIIGDDQH